MRRTGALPGWCALIALLLALAFEAIGQPSDAPTLAEAIEGAPAAYADRRVTSFEVLAGEDVTLFAGYFEDELEERILRVLHVFLRVGDGAWKHVWFSSSDATFRLGSVVRLYAAGDYFFVGLHRSPSAETTAVLDRSLDHVGTINGWIVAAAPGGHAVFQRSMIHFSSTHSPRLAIYDTESGSERDIYPPSEPTRTRVRISQAYAWLYEHLGDDWCYRRNHHCRAEVLNSSVFDVVVDAAFVDFSVRYRPPVMEMMPLEAVARYRHDRRAGATYELD